MQAEKINTSWTDHVYGLGLTQRGDTFQHWDRLGSLSATSDGQGTQTAGPVFDAFGCTIAGKPSEYGWNGEYLYRHEANIGGLRQVGVRWYDPEIGRFLQKDPAFSAPVYSYCWNDPVDLADYDGLKPGDKYKSADKAAKAALKDIWKKSDSVKVEYGGWVYKNPDGSYSYTRPVRGTEYFVSPPHSDIPKNTIGVGGYHNHIPGFIENEDFSGLDRDFARNYGSVYLLTPTGYIKKYIPGRGDSVIGVLN